jgi:hypothetical protein
MSRALIAVVVVAVAVVPAALAAPAGKGPPNAAGKVADMKRADAAADADEKAVELGAGAFVKACPEVPTRPEARYVWAAQMRTHAKPIHGALDFRNIEGVHARGLVLLAPEYELAYDAKAAADWLDIVQSLKSAQKAVVHLDHKYVTLFDDLALLQCDTAASNFRAASGLPAKRALLDAQIRRLAAFVEAHP